MDIYGFLTFKKVEIIEKADARAQLPMRTIFFGAKFNNTSRNNRKLLFKVNFGKNYTETIIIRS